MSRYIDIHILQTVPPSNINRDDTGAPKTAVYGGVQRHRVSSQAWKRAARAEFNSHLDKSELGERTVRILERVAERIADLEPSLAERSEELAKAVITKAGLKLAKPKKKAEDDEEPKERTGYLLFVSRAQLEALAKLAIANADEPKKIKAKEAKEALNNEHSIDVALFGRMVADAPDLNVDACCQVSHAISVHAAQTEFDYFTAVDDNAPEDNVGAGMIGTVEFVSSTMYRYATVNATELADSLGSVEAAARAVAAFLRAFATSMPTGKQNTFANRTRPDLIVVQVRDDQPVNLSEAFEDPIEATRGRTTAAARALAAYAESQDGAYGSTPADQAFLATGGAAADTALEAMAMFGERTDLNGLVELAENAVREASAS